MSSQSEEPTQLTPFTPALAAAVHPGANGRGHEGSHRPDAVPELQGPGFRLVRWFLWLILLLVGGLLGVAGLLSWHFGMDVSVEGKGVIEPRHRHLVKAEITGIIKRIHVRQGQEVTAGDTLAVLDDTEWRIELRKVGKDLEANRSRRAEIEWQMQSEEQVLKAELTRARAGAETAVLHLRHVRAEQRLYSDALLLSPGRPRSATEELVPVRRAAARLSQEQATVQLIRQRLEAAGGRRHEIETLERIREKLQQDQVFLAHHLGRTTIDAPVNGVVMTGELATRVGDRVQAGEAIVELAEPDGWQTRTAVRENDWPRVRIGQNARLYVHAFPHLEYKIFSGRVERVSGKPGPDGGYPVRISVTDPEVRARGKDYSLACGMTADVRIVVEQGRIAALLWRRLLRSLGDLGRRDLSVDHSGPEA